MSGAGPWGPRFPVAPAPLAADVAIIAALPMEVGFLTDRLTKTRKYSGPHHSVTEGEFGGKLIVVLAGGMGRTSARRATELLLAGHSPRWVVSAGFGGALSRDLNRNDAVIAKEVIDLEGHRFTVDFSLVHDAAKPGPRVTTGRLLTVDAIVRTALEKEELRARFEADVVDMETSAVAALCAERSLRFLSIRVISDDAKHDLPPEVAQLLTRSGSYRIGSALRSIWSRPSSLMDFLALHSHAQEAADRLAEVTLALISRLPA
jgi:adenosylhomocysteine nucleosidase